MKGIPHLYEDDSLTFDDLYGIIIDLSIGELPVYDKVDGQFVFLTKADGVRAARNLSQLRNGGVGLDDIGSKFENHPIQKGLRMAMESFEAACRSVPPEVFEGGSNWYACEIVHDSNVNVFKYPTNFVLLHNNGHIRCRDGAEEPLQGTPESLSAAMCIPGTAFHAPHRISLPEDLMNAHLNALRELRGPDVRDDSSIAEWAVSCMAKDVLRDWSHLPAPVASLVARKLYGDKIPLKEVTKWLRGDSRKSMKAYLKENRGMRDGYLNQVKERIRMLGRDLVTENRSNLLPDDSRYQVTERLTMEVLDFFEKHGTDKENQEIDEALGRIEDQNYIPQHEGYVFEVNGKITKLTGNFPIINRLFWRKRKKVGGGPIVGLYPGKFKPPHRGHWQQVQEMLAKGLDEVRVLISPLAKEGITSSDSLMVWEVYSEMDGRVKPVVATERSPIREVFKHLSEMEPGSRVFLGFGEKDEESFGKVDSWAKDRMPNIFLENCLGAQNDKKITGSKMRSYLINREENSFLEGLPDDLTREQRIKIWEILKRR